LMILLAARFVKNYPCNVKECTRDGTSDVMRNKRRMIQ
jgi:hypothetical protein